MIADALARMCAWRPAERERRLLVLCALLAVALFVHVCHDGMQAAQNDQLQAQQRLEKVRAQFKLLSNNRWRGEIEAQKRLLQANAMTDATPAIGQLRLRTEVLALARSAGLAKPRIIDSYRSSDGQQPPGQPTRYTPLTTTLEADFDWTALVGLLAQLESAGRGYFIDGFAVRQDGEVRRMRVSLRVLHRQPKAGA